ncbi:hypothetical protein EC973_007838 [Apophysomyces ossiformis]|uniref:WRKY domain-containing protein n=1 Tax=Apophysomyces ossiformis TaxID=679940 RepID=A0A8H7EKK8_9FUNG|nr:hypothetical protein EC973_007838 [Apophysomyces ossiformis]
MLTRLLPHQLPSPYRKQSERKHIPKYPQSSSINGEDEEVSTFLNLDKVVQQYGTRPELLELILSSKVEEDRRRAEEAKLRRKEIDYLLHQHQQDTDDHVWQPTKKHLTRNRPSLPALGKLHQNDDRTTLPRLSVPTPPRHRKLPNPIYSATNPISSLVTEPSADSSRTEQASQRRNSSTTNNNNSRAIQMLLTPPHPTPSSAILPPLSSATALSDQPRSLPSHPFPSRSFSDQSTSKRQYTSSDDDSEDEDQPERGKPFSTGLAPPSPPSESLILKQQHPPPLPSHQHHGKIPIPPVHTRPNKRRRREMQAITTIIETREFPYNDDYLWKNNGNTVHKKSGHKSIYYKCSNSAKGCPVNKTVTFKGDGEYLIKYRGEHLKECSRIKRIVDV